jgi:hypothetical protein
VIVAIVAVAAFPTRDLFNQAFSGSRVAVVRSISSGLGRGPIVIYDTATAMTISVKSSFR